MRSLSRGIVLAAVFAAPSALADRPTKQVCIETHEESQSLRREGHLLDARSRLLICSDEACPGVLRKECAAWLATLDAEIPSFIFAVVDAQGHDAVDVRVLVDGRVVSERSDGKPIAMNTGPHLVRIEAPGAPPMEQRLVARQGERGRRLDIRLLPLAPPAASSAPRAAPPAASAVPAASASPPPASPRPAPSPPPDAPAASDPPVAAWVLVGVGALAFGGFTYFALDSRAKQTALDEQLCRPNCPQSEVDAIKRDYHYANLSLATSLVALGGATALFLTARDRPPPRVRAGLAPSPEGAQVVLGASF